jgi:hypothetical protein
VIGHDHKMDEVKKSGDHVIGRSQNELE